MADELLVPLLHSCLWRIRQTLAELFGEVHGLPSREELARALAGREEARIVDQFESVVDAMIEAARAADARAASAAHRARCFIDENFTNPTVSTARVARVAACSEAHLCVLFRKAHGTTVGDYVRWRRVERAKVLLATTSRPVKTVGYESGFGTYRTFLRNFRGFTGMSPRSYRRLAERGRAPVASDATRTRRSPRRSRASREALCQRNATLPLVIPCGPQ